MSSIRKIIIANRGEIAVRVMQTARRLGISTVAVYSDADVEAPHVALADEAILIGPGPVGESYLVIDKILDAARQTNADAIHPGYGFLSENADFADAVQKAGLIFIGPDAEAISLMGNKAAAKRRMIEAGVPCVPGYEDADQSDERLIQAAKEIKFPIMVKAAAGGGGRAGDRAGSGVDRQAGRQTHRREGRGARRVSGGVDLRDGAIRGQGAGGGVGQR